MYRTARTHPRPHSRLRLPLLLILAAVLFLPALLLAQTGGEAGIQGTVADATGAAIPHATVTATNIATGIATSRETSGAGLYTISPIAPGSYTVTVNASGFSQHIQQNFTINALVLTPLDVAMTIGEQSTSVTVNEAPPQLETTNATLQLTIENTTFANLPLQMNNAQRDPTAFGSLAPGAQGGARLPIIGGTGNYLGQLYLDGLPAETVNQQGDNRVVSQALSVDAVDQLQVVTSTPPAEYSGAGAENLTMKSGGLQYHGQVSDFIRNTAFDAWGFVTKEQTIKNSAGVLIPAPKPVDHQNEFSASAGGHAPFTRKIFFFAAYDRFHSRRVANPVGITVPSVLEKMGDFTELNGGVGTGGLTGTANNPAFLFDPTSTTCANGTCTRTPFQGLKNGVPTNNVIPTAYLSPITLGMQKFLPDPSNPSTLINNYTAGIPTGFDNHLIDYRVDYDINAKHRLSTVGAIGTVNYLNNYQTPFLPLPYTGGTQAHIFPRVFDAEERWTISNSLVNQLKYGFVRFRQPQTNATDGNPAFAISAFGVTNLPGGQANTEFPGVSFAATPNFGNATTTWTSNSNAAADQTVTPNTYSLVDNLQLVKGRHAITAGITVEWQQLNNANPATFTGILSLPFTGYSTAQFQGSTLNLGTASSTNSATGVVTPGVSNGYSYASFLLGAVGGSPSIGLQYVSEVGGRYRPIAPYIEDTFKLSNKITIDAGLRWDYLPPYREVKDRISFLNPTLTNAATGTPGALQFAGNYGGAGVSCGCHTPVQTYWKNYGPRVGVTYAPNPRTVFRAGFGHVFSQAGGVGGRGGAALGTGQLGFNPVASAPAEVTTGAGAGPSFYLNNGAAFTANGQANTSLYGAGFNYPTAPTIGAASQTLNTGYYLNPATGKFVTPNTITYADPYFSGRAPDFSFYNFGIQEALTPNLTLALNYVGNESHHLQNATNSGTGGARGYWNNQLNPIYLAALGPLTDAGGKNPLLTSAATAANVAKAQAAMPGLNIPVFFQNAAAVSSTATIAQGLVAFPQYSGVSDIWGTNVGNFTYNSLQVTLEQRLAHGLTFNVNYTFSRNIGDDGTFRSGFDIPSGAISGNARSYHMDRIDRGPTTVQTPHVIHAYGVYQLPFGRGHMGGNTLIGRALTSGWQFSAIYTYANGTPAAVTYAGCTTPLQGQCMPDVNPNYPGNNARINGHFGSGPSGRNACNLGVGTGCTAIPYFDKNGFQAPSRASPTTVAPLNLIGNSPRTEPLYLTNPGSQNLDTSLRRNIALSDRLGIVIEVDCLNTFNHTIFSSPNAVYGSAAFGTISSTANNPRDFQLAGHFNF